MKTVDKSNFTAASEYELLRPQCAMDVLIVPVGVEYVHKHAVRRKAAGTIW